MSIDLTDPVWQQSLLTVSLTINGALILLLAALWLKYRRRD